METKKLGVGISKEAHNILTAYQKEKGLSTLDDAVDTFLKEKGGKKKR